MPLLFLLYTADLNNITRGHGLMSHYYADDTQLYLFCRPEERLTLRTAVTSCIGDIDRWMRSNRLRLNPSKTEFLWLATHRRLNHGRREYATSMT